MKNKKSLSERQLAILRAIWEHSRESGWSPSLREIRDETTLASPTTVRHHIKTLSERGYVKYVPGMARGMSLTASGEALFDQTPPAAAIVTIPLKGNIVASQPVEVDHDTFSPYDEEDAIQISAFLLNERRTDDLFALRVRGNSMIDAMVEDGDIVVMRKPETVRDGDMVAVWLSPGDITTLKHIYREGNRIRLQPANPLCETIYVKPDHVTVQGKVIMVLRNTNNHRRLNGRHLN